jgi:hypothetical protein
MRSLLLSAVFALLGVASPVPVLAFDDSFAKVMPYMRLGTASEDTVRNVTIGLGAMAVGLVVFAVVYNRRRTRKLRLVGAAGVAKKAKLSFRQQAGVMGFKFIEAKILKRLADRLSPQRPENLLTTPSGRQFLMADLEKRIRRREREIGTLNSIQAKLEQMRDSQTHERGSLRVDADLPIWIVRKAQPGAAGPQAEEALVNIEPVTGRLADISEGGAAATADLDVYPGDVAELWSTETGIWIPPITAAVVHREDRDDAPPLFHLQFLDPPVAELRAALQEIQIRNNRAIFDQADQRTESGA